MAGVLEQDGIFVAYQFEDEDGNKTTRRFQLQWDTDLATTLANAEAMRVSLQAITDAAVNRMIVGLQYDEDSPVARGGENQEVAHLSVSLVENAPTGMSKTAVIELPAPDAGIRVAPTGPGSNLIDTADAALATFLAHFLPGGEAYLSHGQDMIEITGGYVHHKESKKG